MNVFRQMRRAIGSVTRHPSSSSRLFVVFAFLLTRTNLFPAGSVVFWENARVLRPGIYVRRRGERERREWISKAGKKKYRRAREREKEILGVSGWKENEDYLDDALVFSSLLPSLLFSSASCLLVRGASSHLRRSSLQRRRQRQRFVPISSQDY